jgi:Archaeal PaREP1/PaREP8 family.
MMQNVILTDRRIIANTNVILYNVNISDYKYYKDNVIINTEFGNPSSINVAGPIDEEYTKLQQQTSNLYIDINEWPEIYDIHISLKTNKELTKKDLDWINAISKAIGWEEEDVIEEIKNLDADPSQRAQHYKSLFDKYFSNAINEFNNKDYSQAAEKIWGSFTALVKYHAAKNNIPILEWDHRKIRNYINANLPSTLSNLFKDLYDNVYQLHILFYEGIKDEDLISFKAYWEKSNELLNKILPIINVC